MHAGRALHSRREDQAQAANDDRHHDRERQGDPHPLGDAFLQVANPLEGVLKLTVALGQRRHHRIQLALEDPERSINISVGHILNRHERQPGQPR